MAEYFGDEKWNGYVYLEGIGWKIGSKFIAPAPVTLPGYIHEVQPPVLESYNYDLEKQVVAWFEAKQRAKEAVKKVKQQMLEMREGQLKEAALKRAETDEHNADMTNCNDSATVGDGVLSQDEDSGWVSGPGGTEEGPIVGEGVSDGTVAAADVPKRNFESDILQPVMLVPATGPDPGGAGQAPATRERFDLADFESVNASPFDSVALKSIDDIEELRNVLRLMENGPPLGRPPAPPSSGADVPAPRAGFSNPTGPLGAPPPEVTVGSTPPAGHQRVPDNSPKYSTTAAHQVPDHLGGRVFPSVPSRHPAPLSVGGDVSGGATLLLSRVSQGPAAVSVAPPIPSVGRRPLPAPHSQSMYYSAGVAAPLPVQHRLPPFPNQPFPNPSMTPLNVPLTTAPSSRPMWHYRDEISNANAPHRQRNHQMLPSTLPNFAPTYKNGPLLSNPSNNDPGRREFSAFPNARNSFPLSSYLCPVPKSFRTPDNSNPTTQDQGAPPRLDLLPVHNVYQPRRTSTRTWDVQAGSVGGSTGGEVSAEMKPVPIRSSRSISDLRSLLDESDKIISVPPTSSSRSTPEPTLTHAHDATDSDTDPAVNRTLNGHRSLSTENINHHVTMTTAATPPTSTADAILRLDPVQRGFAEWVASMGFPRTRVAFAVSNYGSIERVVVEFLCSADRICSMGYPEQLVLQGLAHHHGNDQQVMEFIDVCQQFIGLGFKPDTVIKQALINHTNTDELLDSLTRL